MVIPPAAPRRRARPDLAERVRRTFDASPQARANLKQSVDRNRRMAGMHGGLMPPGALAAGGRHGGR